ncbi:MAG TPA: phosphoglycerate mutase family protein [Pyrinomonadaceae bacterium]|nr:phosphoglycerate mutase family protein [Pyrinomonadaceae bacterium]
MRKLLLTITLLITLFPLAATAQEKLIILVRHAEKAELESEGNPDPELSAAGKQRAERFREVIGRYRPGAVYSTDYRRTRETAQPIAAKRKKQVQVYDPRQPKELIDRILASDIKRHVIVGHSNTVPSLANLILGKEIFRNLEESEYSVIWLIRLKNGRVTEARLLDY